MKRKIALIMALLMLSGASAVVSATDVDTDGGNASTSFTYEYANDPTFTVTIPESITITNTGADMTISAENVANLGNQKISVKIAGTDQYRNQMVLSGKSESGSSYVMRYQIILPDETIIETTGEKDQVNGVELASFTEDGSVDLRVLPVVLPSSSKGVTYNGSMTYLIELTDAE